MSVRIAVAQERLYVVLYLLGLDLALVQLKGSPPVHNDAYVKMIIASDVIALLSEQLTD